MRFITNFTNCYILWICCLVACFGFGECVQRKNHKGNPLVAIDSLIFISTLDGVLHAVSRITGETQWSLKEQPVLKVPDNQGPSFLPDPKDGSLYVFGDALKKLPFTIPELVTASPCKSTDGILYTGYKKDMWYAVDPLTGQKLETLTMEGAQKVCPSNMGSALFIGRTEYTIVMFDSKTREKRWNATFMDYSSQSAADISDYSLRHFASSSDGQVVTLDGETGDTLWISDFNSPVVAMYGLQTDHSLHKVPYFSMASETLQHLTGRLTTSNWKERFLQHGRKQTFYPTLYVGESAEVLYALPALVDEDTVTIAPRNRGPLLLEGPKNEDYYESTDTDESDTAPNTTILLIGYHEVPEQTKSRLDKTRQIAYVKNGEEMRIGENKTHTNSGKNSDQIVSRKERETEYISGDVKFVVTVVIGLAVIVAVVYLLPKKKKVPTATLR